LKGIALREYFGAVVSAEDVAEGKPSPEIFLQALNLLNQKAPGGNPIPASECLVIEDSKEGILAAHSAGMKCLAVANSHPEKELRDAEAVVKSLQEVTVPFLESLFQ
jgi:beta-phosphoglucomutase-like phosphatase (HAD superfamily)